MLTMDRLEASAIRLIRNECQFDINFRKLSQRMKANDRANIAPREVLNIDICEAHNSSHPDERWAKQDRGEYI